LLLAPIDALVASTARLADAGEMPPTQAALFAIERTSRRQALIGYRAEAAAQEQRVRSLLGLSPGAAVTLEPGLGVPRDAADEGEGAVAARSPRLARLRAEYRAAEETLRREVREQYPDLTIGPAAELDRGDALLGVSISLPIPILNANRQGIARAHASREVARAAFETAYERSIGSLAAARAELEGARAQRAVLETDLVPLVDRQVEQARRLLGLGEGGGLVLLESLSRAWDARIRLIDARLNESLARVEVAAVVGPPLPGGETAYSEAAR